MCNILLVTVSAVAIFSFNELIIHTYRPHMFVVYEYVAITGSQALEPQGLRDDPSNIAYKFASYDILSTI